MERFVVGSGRCGSTLLSRMLGCSPDVLPISEFLNGIPDTHRFAESLDGAELAAILSAPQPFLSAVTQRGYPVAERVYPFDAAGARFQPQDPLPWLLVSTLPSISEQPDALFDKTCAWLSSQPTGPAEALYRRLFAFLAEEAGRPLWVERSGSAIDYAGFLAARFPDARLVHLHRRGEETALSMREHPSYRLAVALRYNAEIAPGQRAGELPGLDFTAPPQERDALHRILASRPDPALFGQFWAEQVGRGLDALAAVPGDRVLPLAFEDLVTEPVVALRALAAFFDIPDGPWVEQAAGMSRGVPAPRLDGLAPDDAGRLSAVCAPVMARLRP